MEPQSPSIRKFDHAAIDEAVRRRELSTADQYRVKRDIATNTLTSLVRSLIPKIQTAASEALERILATRYQESASTEEIVIGYRQKRMWLFFQYHQQLTEKRATWKISSLVFKYVLASDGHVYVSSTSIYNEDRHKKWKGYHRIDSEDIDLAKFDWFQPDAKDASEKIDNELSRLISSLEYLGKRRS